LIPYPFTLVTEAVEMPVVVVVAVVALALLLPPRSPLLLLIHLLYLQ
jgi:hypothetical protein